MYKTLIKFPVFEAIVSIERHRRGKKLLSIFQSEISRFPVFPNRLDHLIKLFLPIIAIQRQRHAQLQQSEPSSISVMKLKDEPGFCVV